MVILLKVLYSVEFMNKVLKCLSASKTRNNINSL